MLLSTKSLVAVAALVVACLDPASANINFVKYAPNTILNPGAMMDVRWVMIPANGTENVAPFNLVLRALSGQRYDVQQSVPQQALRVRVQVPQNATGGLHSWYADYVGTDNLKGISTNQFNVTGPVVPTPEPVLPPASSAGSATNSGSLPTATPHADGESSSLSTGALVGIIVGVVIVALVGLVVLIRHRRRAAEDREELKSVDDHKDSYNQAQFGARSMDKESLARAGGPPAIHTGPFPGSPGARPPHPNQREDYHGPHSPRSGSHSPRSGHGSDMDPHSSRSPFGGDSIPPPMLTSLSPRQQHQPYPPQYNQPPYSPHQQQQPYGPPRPMHQQHPHPHQQQRVQSPYHQSSRDSFESEPESAYDPNHPQFNKNAHPAGRGLSHSASGRSVMSNPRTMNMSPHPQQQQNPFQDPERLATAAAAAAVSPIQAHRQLQQNSHHQELQSQSSMSQGRAKEIEMQPLEIQQHHLEQQQRVMLRQQQQGSAPQPMHPPGAGAHPFNPTQYDDKTEVDDDGVPVYNGYRDTIFGAYAPRDDEDEGSSDDDRTAPGAIAPLAALTQTGNSAQQQQSTGGQNEVGGAEIQRKKSVKFTGVPASGPIVMAASEVTKPKQTKRQSDVEYSDDDEPYDVEDEDDIKMRLMETEVPSPMSTSSRPAYTESTPISSPHPVHALSPVRSPALPVGSPASQYQVAQGHAGGFVAPPPPPTADNFYSEVISAVNKNAKTLPSVVASTAAPAPVTPLSYQRPVMPPVPRSPSPQSPTPQQQHFVQQQHIPAPQPQTLQQPLTKEVYGAPSPRITPAAAAGAPSHHQTTPYTPPAPRTQGPPMSSSHAPIAGHRGPVDDDDEKAFYESSLL